MSTPHFSVDNRKAYVPKSSSSGLVTVWIKSLPTDTSSLRTSLVKGSEPLNSKHEKIILDIPDKVGTVTSCPHVNDIKVEKTRGGPVGGAICGSPKVV